MRKGVLAGDNLRDMVMDLIDELSAEIVQRFGADVHAEGDGAGHGAARGHFRDGFLPPLVAFADVALQAPVPRAQLGAGLEQRVAGDRAVPVAFGGALQLALGADGGEAEVVGASHRTAGGLMTLRR